MNRILVDYINCGDWMDLLRKKSLKAGEGISIRNILVLITLLMISQGVMSMDIYVPDNYSSIQAAVDNATNGDVLIIRDGEYIENINVDKSIIIKSENGTANCTVKPFNTNSAIFSLESNSISIYGLSISGSLTKEGIYVTADECNISLNCITKNFYGISLYHSSGNIIHSNHLSENSRGIYAYHSQENSLNGNNIINNEEGISLINSPNNLIEKNDATFNTYGVQISSSDNNTVSNNILSNNKHSLEIDTSEENILINNTISSSVNGVRLKYSNRNSIKDNMLISNYEKGFYIYMSLCNQLSNNSAINCTGGFYLLNSSENIVEENKAGNCSIGFLIKNTENTSIINNSANFNTEGFVAENLKNANIAKNSAVSNFHGFRISDSVNSSLSENNAESNSINFVLSGTYDAHFNNTIETSNNVDGKPVYYIKNVKNNTYDSTTNAGVFYCIWCENVTIRDLFMANNSEGLFFWGSNDSRVFNITSFNSDKGAYLYNSHNNTFESVRVSSNNYGLYLADSDKNRINSSEISNCLRGLYLKSTCNNDLTRTIIRKNGEGFYSEFSSQNILYLNTFEDNSDDVLEVSSSNSFNSTLEMYYMFNGSVFNERLGNNWDRYTGQDNDSNGIGDIPYTISPGIDFYPLVDGTSRFNVLSKADLTIENLLLPDLKEGETGNIALISSNTGYANSTNINISVTVNGQEIGRKKISLKIGEEKTLNFTWSPDEGSYIIEGIIDPENKIAESNESNNQISRNKTIEKPPQPKSTPKASEKHAGSSGGGPLKPLPPPFELNHSEYDSYSTYLMKGQLKKINSDTKIGKFEVYEIGLLSDISLPVTVFISEIADFPDYIEAPNRTVNYSFELIVTRYPTQQKVEPYGYVKFRVPVEFFEENDVSPLTVNLTRYTNGKWVEIPKEYMGGDGDYHYYSVDLNFSCIFSITAYKTVEYVREVNINETSVNTSSEVELEVNQNPQLNSTPMLNGSITGYINQDPWWKHTTSLIALFAGVLATTGLTVYFSRMKKRGGL